MISVGAINCMQRRQAVFDTSEALRASNTTLSVARTPRLALDELDEVDELAEPEDAAPNTGVDIIIRHILCKKKPCRAV
jgi:hypothetical protein